MGACNMDMIQLIVECINSEEREKTINKLGKIKYKLPMINSYVIEIPKKNLKELSSLKGIKEVHYNTTIAAQMNNARITINANNVQSLTGRDVTIAILDTGVSNISDIILPKNRIIAFKDFVNGIAEPYDDNGHGTHVSTIALGNGIMSKGKYKGIASNANLVAVKILDENGKGNSFDVLAGVQWVLNNRDKYNIKIMNLSVGTVDVGRNDPLIKAVEKAWDLGIVVVIAAGNNGPNKGTVTSPGISRKVITVGSSEDCGTAWIAGETVENFSGCGPTSECIVKPDIVAPGKDIVSCLTKTFPKLKRMDNDFKPVDGHYVKMSGTSMSTPMVSGAIALLLEKYPYLYPNDVKLRLKKTANDLNYPRNRQGWGLIDINNLIEN
jgi:serine protease AprX